MARTPRPFAPCALALLALAAAGPAVADPAAQPATECTMDLTPEQGRFAALLAEAGVYDAARGADSGWVFVPITLHVVRRSNGTGGLTTERLAAAMADAAAAYAPAKIAFCLPGPVDYINSDQFFTLENMSEVDALRQTNVVPNTINIYFAETSLFCGISAFTFSSVQGIVMANACTGIPTNRSTYPHEIGHYFNLYHTHERATGAECVSGSNCFSAGDQVCDTPSDPTLGTNNVNTSCQYTGTTLGPCAGDGPYRPDPRNYMSYSRKECRDVFTPGQFLRVRATLFNLRPNLVNTLAGETNGDGLVDFADLNAVLSAFGASGSPGFSPGDVNGDGLVDFADLNLVLGSFGARAC